MIGLLAGWLVSRSIARGGALTLPHARRLAKVGLVVAGVVLLVAGFGIWLALHDRGVVEADRNASRAEAVSRAREADQRSHEAQAGVRDGIEAQNREAERAAAESEDPLKAGLDELRNHQR